MLLCGIVYRFCLCFYRSRICWWRCWRCFNYRCRLVVFNLGCRIFDRCAGALCCQTMGGTTAFGTSVGIRMPLRGRRNIQGNIAIHAPMVECTRVGGNQCTNGALHAHTTRTITCCNRRNAFTVLNAVITWSRRCFLHSRGRIVWGICFNGIYRIDSSCSRFLCDRFQPCCRSAAGALNSIGRAVMGRVHHSGVLACLVARAHDKIHDRIIHNRIGTQADNGIAIALWNHRPMDIAARNIHGAALQNCLCFITGDHDACRKWLAQIGLHIQAAQTCHRAH